MNSVNRYHIPYESTLEFVEIANDFQMHKAGPLLGRKMLKYDFGNMKYIGEYFVTCFKQFDKFLKSHRSTKFYDSDDDWDESDYDRDDDRDESDYDRDADRTDQDIEVFFFHHCKKCKDLTSRHRRSMFAFLRLKLEGDPVIHCFILF